MYFIFTDYQTKSLATGVSSLMIGNRPSGDQIGLSVLARSGSPAKSGKLYSLDP